MKLSEWWALLFIAQGLVIFVDEFYFHIRRGLPKWERVGHPMDTLSVLIPFVFALLVPATSTSISVYVGLAIFSSVLITKDEFVHKELCTGAEQWLHSVLFILHPLVLILAGLIWAERATSSPRLWQALQFQTGLISLFLIYQIVYWSFVWKEPSQIAPSTTTSTINSDLVGTPLTTTRSLS